MHVRVVYHNNTCDMLPVYILQLAIDCKQIKLFYRNSERRWITVGSDPMRLTADILAPYDGPERRDPQRFVSPLYRAGSHSS